MMHQQPVSPKNRRGATAVEFALVTPLFFLLFFAAVEFSRMNMVRHTVDIAAYEGARQGIIPGATAADVQNRVNQVLAQVGVNNSNVVVTPSTINAVTNEVTVDVAAPMNNNNFMFGIFMTGMNVTAQSKLAREGFTGGP